MLKRFALAIWIVAASLAPAGAAERVERFISEVEVQRNGDLLVTETIQVRAEGRQIRRGILRDFPTVYRRTDGSRVEVGFHVQSVVRDGRPEDFETERMSNGVRVRIGSARRFLSTGSHHYIIKYRTTRQIGFFEKFDELYWNATGTGWTFPIDFAEARIKLPEQVEFQRSAIYTGPQGARGKDAEVVEQRPGWIVFRTTKPLPVRNGLTVAAAWPKGVTIEPTRMQQFQSMLQDDPALIYAGAGAALVIAFYLLAWFLVGRDPRRGTIIPLFGPPEGMSAAAVRYVSQMAFDERAFTAAIVGLGVNGHLKLSDRGGKKVLTRIDGKKVLDAAEQTVKAELFAKRSTLVLSNTEHTLIAGAKLALWKALRAAFHGKLFSNNFWWSIAGFIATIAVIAATGYAYSNSYGSNASGILAGMLIPLLPIMVGAAMMRSGLREDDRAGSWRFAIGLIVVTIAAVIGIVIMGYNAGFGPAILPGILAFMITAFATQAFYWLQAPTRAGRKVMDQIEGFKQYLDVAEEDRLNFLNPPEKTPELFEKFLPYAIALGCENRWAERFTGVLAAAGVTAAVSSWYTSDTHNNDNATSFADRVGDSLSQTIASASAAPGSSGGGGGSSGGGSSGGGSSGGGGGGGGGSGW